MASNDTLTLWDATSAQPPATGFATLDVRNGHVVLDFDDAAAESADFAAIMPSAYSGANGLVVFVTWSATSATSGNVRWSAQLERHDLGFDLDGDGFSSQVATETAVSPAAGELAQSSIDLSGLPAADLPQAGETFRLRVTREANHSGDTLVGDAELLAVELREA